MRGWIAWRQCICRMGVRCAVNKLGGQHFCYAGSDNIYLYISAGGLEREKGPPALLFLEESAKDPCPPAQVLRFVNKSP